MINKRLLATVLIVLISAVLPIMIGCTKATHTETIELGMITGVQGLSGEMATTVGGWIEEVEAASGGRVKINILVGAAPDAELYDALLAGTGDLVCTLIQFYTGRFPVLELMTIPDIGTVCQQPSQVAWEMWKLFPEIQDEFSDTKVLAHWAATPSPPGVGFGTTKKPVRSLDDIKGMKIGVFGLWSTKTIEKLGAVAVPVPPPALYESLQKGIADGSTFDPEMLVSYKLEEVIKYYHTVSFTNAPFVFAMNWDSWNSLPPDIQKIFEEAAAKIPKVADDFHKAGAQAALEHAKANFGMEVIEVSPEIVAKWQELQDPVQDEYFAKLQEEKGIDGRKIHDEMQRLFAKYAE